MYQISLQFVRLVRTIGMIAIVAMLSISVAGHESIEECPSEVISAEFEFIFSRLDSPPDESVESYSLLPNRPTNARLTRPQAEQSFFCLSQRNRLNGVGAYLLI